MTHPNSSTALAWVIIDELSRNGLELVVLSPGSRSGALAIAASAHPDIETVVVLDERSAAFHALGRAKATGKPAAVVSTSGTAPANWFPAVVEADMSLTPLLLISADRPPEMRGVGANQTIDQVRMFGEKTRFFAELEAPVNQDRNADWRRLVCEAISMARGGLSAPGPVHLDVAFREPTVPVSDDGRTVSETYVHPTDGASGGLPWAQGEAPLIDDDRGEIPHLKRGLVLAGDGRYDRPGLLAAADRLGWPVLATALSGLRGLDVIDSYHHMMAGPLPAAMIPEIAVAVGNIGPSQRLEALFGSASQRVRIDSWGRPIDPGQNATMMLRADPVKVLAGMTLVAGRSEAWAGLWAGSAAAVREALTKRLSGLPFATGAGIAVALDSIEWGCLVVASSLPIREIDAHLTRSGPVIANRGASGIDGLVSTALGAATAIPRVVGFSGDLSLLHDANGYLTDRAQDLVMVVADNNGGGLFDSLPQALHAPDFERLFVTPHNRDITHLARFHRIHYVEADTAEALADAAEQLLARGGRSMIRVAVDRATDLETRRSLDEAGVSTLASLHP